MKKIFLLTLFLNFCIDCVSSDQTTSNGSDNLFQQNLFVIIVSFITSIATCIITSYVTSKNKSQEIKSIYTKNLQAKRLEYYPLLHKETDKLGSFIRKYISLKYNICEFKQTLKDQLAQIEKWDANYAIYSGPFVTNELFKTRRYLEKLIDQNDDIELEQLDNLMIYLNDLEFHLKSELGVLIKSSLKIEKEAKYNNKKYRKLIEKEDVN